MLADDHALVLEAFRKMLEPRYDVVGTVADGHALLGSAPLLKPDVVVIDIEMPLLNGLDAGRELKRKMPGVKVVFLTMNQDPDLAAEAMRMGVSGYILKTSGPSELFHAIEEALKGRFYVTKQIASRVQKDFVRDPRPKKQEEYRHLLTPRQRQVIQLLAEGKTMKQVADVLELTPRTVAFHKYRIMEIMGFKSNADLVQFAVKERIVAT